MEIFSSESRVPFGFELFEQPDGVSEIPLFLQWWVHGAYLISHGIKDLLI